MAVSKIRKFSSWTLIAIFVISILIILAYFLGGDNEPLMKNGDALWNPKFLDTLMIWMYLLFVIALGSLLLFGIFQFLKKFKSSPKVALTGLGFFIGLVVLLVITYAIGDTTPIAKINADSQQYNTPFWLKISDMWLYSMYALLAISVVAIIWGSVKKSIKK